MQTMRRLIQLVACLAVISIGPWNRTETFAQRALGGAELENGCQIYADKAVKIAKTWEERQCRDKLDYAPQLMHTDRDWHLK